MTTTMQTNLETISTTLRKVHRLELMMTLGTSMKTFRSLKLKLALKRRRHRLYLPLKTFTYQPNLS